MKFLIFFHEEIAEQRHIEWCIKFIMLINCVHRVIQRLIRQNKLFVI